MGMTIDEAIKEINWSIKVHKKILETDAKELDIDSAWVKHWKSIVEAFDIAIDTMRKYQKIQEIVNSKTTRLSYETGFRQIKEVLNNGNDD